MQRLPWFSAAALGVALALICPLGLAQRGIYTVFGQVQLPDGKPADGVTVQINASSGYSAQTITNDEGQYEFSSLPTGRYRLTATIRPGPTCTLTAVDTDVSRAPSLQVMVHLFFRAVADAQGKPPERAVVSVPEIAQRIPKDAEKAYEKALEQRSKGDIDRATESISKALALFPDYFQALTFRGELAIKQGKTADALSDFSAALKINPDFEPALRGSGFCKLQQRKIADAAIDLERASAAESSGDSDAHLYFGIATLALDRRIEARQSLEQALAAGTDGAVTAHIYLANLEAAEGRFRAAADQLAAYLALRPDGTNAGKLKLQETEWRQRGASKALIGARTRGGPPKGVRNKAQGIAVYALSEHAPGRSVVPPRGGVTAC